MVTERSIIFGQRIAEARKFLGMTQKEFGEWLGEHGINNRKGIPGVRPEIVASWESGRNQARTKVLKIIYDNIVLGDEKRYNWGYLIGESEIKHEEIQVKEKKPNINDLQYYSTDELLAEIKRRTELP